MYVTKPLYFERFTIFPSISVTLKSEIEFAVSGVTVSLDESTVVKYLLEALQVTNGRIILTLFFVVIALKEEK